EDYAVTTRIAPSAALEAAIEELLADGLGDSERLAEIGRLVLQRAVEEELTAFLGRGRYERTPEAAGPRNGERPRPGPAAEGELEIQVPQIRGAAEKFVQRAPERADGGPDEAAGSADHRRLGARVVGPRHREPGRRGRAGAALEDRGLRDHQGAAGPLP